MKELTIIGVDPGRRHTGICAWSMREKRVVGNMTFNMSVDQARKESPFNPEWWRLHCLRGEIVQFCEDFPNPVGVIEQYPFYGKMTKEDFEKMDKSIMDLAETHGAIQCALAQLNAPSVKVTPTQVKCFVTGNGAADKRQVIKSVFAMYGTALEDEHQFDAMCMCHIGRYLVVFIVDPWRLKKGTYEYNTCNDIKMYFKHKGFAEAILTLLK